MARPREFEEEAALERAMQVFWQHGYKDASLPDLLDGMGLTRGSLYKAFKDKKTLFLLALERYEKVQVDAAAGLLTNQSAGNGTDRIKAMFAGLIAAVRNGDHRGCMLCTSAANAAGDDSEIATAVHRGLAKLQSALAFALGDQTGIDPRHQARLANTLLTQYVGLHMLARSRLPLGILEQYHESVETILAGAA